MVDRLVADLLVLPAVALLPSREDLRRVVALPSRVDLRRVVALLHSPEEVLLMMVGRRTMATGPMELLMLAVYLLRALPRAL